VFYTPTNMQLLDGRACAQSILEELKARVTKRLIEGGKRPHLVAILVGNDGGSTTYVESKLKTCESIGFIGSLIHLDVNITEQTLLDKIEQLNKDSDIDGFLVQLPLPAHINESKILLAIDPRKDVDGFHPHNVGNMALNLPGFLPATPGGILELIRRNNIETEGKHCVIIGRSHIVGSPLSILLARNTYPGNCTVTLAHSRTKNLKDICKQADILVAALGSPNFVDQEMVKQGAVVIDVGTSRIADSSRIRGWRLCGDVDFKQVAPKCSFITPVPGGVGPMTIAQLMSNTLQAVELNEKKNIYEQAN